MGTEYIPPEVDDDQGQENPDPRHAADVAMAARQVYMEPDLPHYLGAMDVVCTDCEAKHYLAEKLSHSSIRNPKFGICCLQGQVKLDPPQPPPAGLKQLWTSGNEVSKVFHKFPRRCSARSRTQMSELFRKKSPFGGISRCARSE